MEYYDSRIKLFEDKAWIYENSDKIIQIIKESESKDILSAKLKDEFGLNDYQIKKLFQMRFDMITKDEYLNTKAEIKEINEKISGNNENKMLYINKKIKNIYLQIEKINSYLKFAENFEEIFKESLKLENSDAIEKMLMEKFEFTKVQAATYKYFTINDFSAEKQSENKRKIESLENMLKYYTNQKLELLKDNNISVM